MKVAGIFIAFLSLSVGFLLALLSKVIKRKDSEISSLKQELGQAQVQSVTKEKESEVARNVSRLVVNTLQSTLQTAQQKEEVKELLQDTATDGSLSEVDIIAFGQKQIEIDKERRR